VIRADRADVSPAIGGVQICHHDAAPLHSRRASAIEQIPSIVSQE